MSNHVVGTSLKQLKGRFLTVLQSRVLLFPVLKHVVILRPFQFDRYFVRWSEKVLLFFHHSPLLRIHFVRQRISSKSSTFIWSQSPTSSVRSPTFHSTLTLVGSDNDVTWQETWHPSKSVNIFTSRFNHILSTGWCLVCVWKLFEIGGSEFFF